MKFKELMDGLDCSVIAKRELERTLRIDAEFYSKEALISDRKIRAISHERLTKLVNVSDGNHAGISDRFQEEGVPYYRGQDAGTFFIENSSPIYIDSDTFSLPFMQRSHLKKSDVLLSIVGTIGSLSLVYSEKAATCSCKLAILRPKDPGNAEYLAAFLNCKYGQTQIKRLTRGAVQMGLILEDMDQLVVPTVGDNLIKQIRDTVISAHKKQEESASAYDAAETLLNQSFCFDNSSIPQSSISEKLYSQSFLMEDRIDSEFYQPKYDYIKKALYEYDPGVLTLDEIAIYLFTGEYAEEYSQKASSNNLCNYIRGTDIRFGSVEKDDKHCVNPANFTKFVSTGDIVTGRVGTIGNFGIVDDALDGAVCSDNILCFRLPEGYLPDVYTLYFNTPIINELIKRLARGSVQQRLNQETLRKVSIPLIHMDTQKKISSLVQKSYQLRKESMQLLEFAKRAVEIAIEQDEATAVCWLRERAGEQ